MGGLMSNRKDEKVCGCWQMLVGANWNCYYFGEWLPINRDEKYLGDALLTWDIIKKYIIEGKDGEFMIQECACKSLKE